MACAPSPSKKASFGPTPVLQPVQDGLRGSFQRQASTTWEDQIRAGAVRSRAAVNRGSLTTAQSTTRRPLGPAKTEPTLRFTQNSLADRPTFQSGLDIVDSVYEVTSGKRPNELRGMWETSDLASQTSTRRGVAPQDSGVWGMAGAPAGAVDDGDGFDVDDVFGSSGGNLNFGFLAGGGSNKRRHEDDAAGEAAQDDIEMDATDIEDEADQPTGMFARAPRKSSRKGWSRTQSFPASTFQSTNF
ncbi:hypothetical protein JCM10207_008754 [Rhodosporidiobolus poonsookiae]